MKNQICRIFVNNKWYYGDYDEVHGKIAFEKIINALKDRKKYFDMREIKFSEEEK